MKCKSKISPNLILFVFFNLLFSQAALTQISPKNLSGTITDANGALVENAQVQLLNQSEKIIAETKTDASGRFEFEAAVATYFLRAVKNGMAETNQKIVVSANSPLIIEIVLKPKSLQETVTIAAGDDPLTQESETVTKTGAPLRDLPQSIEIVGQQLIKQQNALSLQDALYNVTAVTVAQGEGRRDQFFIRGFSAVGDEFIDGVRDDAPYYRDLANVERIEVVKGPAAVLYGRGSSGGLINRVTKRPDFNKIVGGAELSFGSYGLKRGSFDYGQPLFGDKLAFRMIGADEKSGSFRHNFFLDRYNLAPSLALKVTSKTDVLFQLEYLNDNRLPDRGLPSFDGRAVNVSLGTNYGYPELDREKNKVFSQAAKIERRLTDFWLVRNVFRHTNYETDFYNTGPNGVALINGQLRVNRFNYSSSSRQDNFFNQTEVVGVTHFRGWQHTVLAGLELGSQNKNSIRFDRAAGSVSLVNPVLTKPLVNNSPSSNNEFKGQVFGVYFQDQINFTPKWKALFGARFDNFEQRLDDLRPTNVDLKRTDKQWSPRAGLVYQPAEWLSLYASYTKSFQPSGENLSLAANNTELKPEMTRNYEAGIKASISRLRLNTTLAVFRLDRDNIKTTDPNNPTLLLLVGEQRTDGIEATMNGSPFRKLEITAGYALLSARILRSNTFSSGILLEGRRAGLVPQSSGNLWINYQLPKQFRVGFGAFARSNVFTSANNLVTLPGFVRLDAAFSWRAEKHYEIAFNLKNLANSRYYETSNGDNGILPGAPINGSIALRYRW